LSPIVPVFLKENMYESMKNIVKYNRFCKSPQDIQSAKINSTKHAFIDSSSAKINPAIINSLKVAVKDC